MEYCINFTNKSSQKGKACIYQTDPDLGVHDVMSLAWFAKSAYPTTCLKFKWNVDYCYTWSRQGELKPGIVYNASQTWDADLSKTNSIDFAKDVDLDAYSFTNQTIGSKEGSLYIMEKKSIVAKECSVGIGMSGNGTFVVNAQPNMQLQFTPHPKYWITFGSFEQGEVLDIEEITATALELEFPINQYTLNVTLNEDNTWSIS